MGTRSLDKVLVQQAVITGRVTSSLSGDALTVTPSVALAWRIAGAADFIVFPKPPQLRPGAYFVYRGAPETFFPELETGQSLECRLTVQAEGYQQQDVVFTLTRSQVTPTRVTETYGGVEVDLLKLDAPVRQQDVALLPQPVRLAGRVIEDNDMESPVQGAVVSIVVPAGTSAVTDARGYFRIDDLPTVERVTVQIESGGTTVTEETLLDYGQRVNERVFSLNA